MRVRRVVHGIDDLQWFQRTTTALCNAPRGRQSIALRYRSRARWTGSISLESVVEEASIRYGPIDCIVRRYRLGAAQIRAWVLTMRTFFFFFVRRIMNGIDSMTHK